MEGIDRVNLYENFRNILDEKNSDLYIFLLEQLGESFIINLSRLLKLNIAILRGIEEKFLISYDGTKINKSEFKIIYTENINRFEVENDFLNEKQHDDLVKFIGIIDKFKDEFYAFNALIRLLNDINNDIIKKTKNNEYNSDNTQMYYKRYRKQVFLSHAFDDRLYTLSLFVFMLKKGVFLYVDWMFSREFDNGIDIKNNLSKQLLDSMQLLFLRTINSELSILGNGYIRGWCSWELGTFYTINRRNRDEKYYIELYKSKNKSNHNRQLDGIKPLKAIVSGRLM